MTESDYVTIREQARLTAIGMACDDSLKSVGCRLVLRVDGGYIVGHGPIPATCDLIGCAKDGRWLPMKEE